MPDLPLRRGALERPGLYSDSDTATPRPTYVPVEAPPAEPPRPVSALHESFSIRLVEDETLRGNLTDDEFGPLQQWAQSRLDALASAWADPDDPTGPRRFADAGAQLFELLRLVDLAVGERSQIEPERLVHRLQLLDTLLEPPLLDEPRAATARRRLAALLEQPPQAIGSLSGPKLVERLVDVFG